MEGKPVTLDSNNRVYCTEVDLHVMISLWRILDHDDNDDEDTLIN